MRAAPITRPRTAQTKVLSMVVSFQNEGWRVMPKRLAVKARRAPSAKRARAPTAVSITCRISVIALSLVPVTVNYFLSIS